MHLHIAEQVYEVVAAGGNGGLQQLLATEWPAFYLGSVEIALTSGATLPR